MSTDEGRTGPAALPAQAPPSQAVAPSKAVEAREPSVAARLLAVILAVVIPTVLLGGAAAARRWQQVRAEAQAELLDRARALAAVVQRELALAESTLRALATSPDLIAGRLAQFHRQLNLLPLQADARIVLNDASGQMLVNSLFDFGTPLARRGSPDVVAQTFSTGQR